jgi:hypothetical protein
MIRSNQLLSRCPGVRSTLYNEGGRFRFPFFPGNTPPRINSTKKHLNVGDRVGVKPTTKALIARDTKELLNIINIIGESETVKCIL